MFTFAIKGKKVLLMMLLSIFFTAFSQERFTDGKFVIITSSKVDANYLPEVFTILQSAQRDLRSLWGLNLPEQVTVVVHPTLASFIQESQVPWYIAGIANVEANQIDIQRFKVLTERNILKSTLRHELFHLVQNDDWPRWLAEGLAMHFAGDRLLALPLENVNEEDLNNLLANPTSQQTLYSAMSTAFMWSKPYLAKIRLH